MDRRANKVLLREFASQPFAASHSTQEGHACYSAGCGESQTGRETKAVEIHLRAGTSMDPLREIVRSVNTTDIIVTATLYRLVTTELKCFCPFHSLITCQVLDQKH